MKFGKVAQPELIDFTLPETHPKTIELLNSYEKGGTPNVYVGCAKWNKADLKGFYPRGTKDELEYYSKQFNSIELNATFYRQFPAEQFEKWKAKTPENFKFFPKLGQEISHWKRLQGVQDAVNVYLDNASHLQEKLGTIFLQLHANFGNKNFDRLQNFVVSWPKGIPLAIEVRHPDWFEDTRVFEEFTQLFEEHNIANVLVDTAGRRDMMHMRLTNNEAFVRYVGANHPSDYTRLDDWVVRLKEWNDLGLENIHFFIHQNLEVESPLLAAYFIKKLNKELGVDLKIPNEENNQQMSLL
ncbi:Uncharacterized conserved protein YecE, DUF72 family [Tenacibaculum mesophilum]|uniref:DUF72 domain-containing protein n=1 Tax=Tenacibaculum mesophilum TaxID=104268 RepID=A0ABN5T2U4_9FLAO|nr:DUF72 domain-containing protein [Tenacibaculum mesophilum]AZJ31575.1 DUF72 domain-containing protein [Tenacibaculum mesophilum]QFS29623.1 DUF72 domain-containing protein [Tenacibaculum mesophilum]SHG00294.1 Uncharacterized conserved protein YecE, DUF72 family [Tenacibaculum mesophilum]